MVLHCRANRLYSNAFFDGKDVWMQNEDIFKDGLLFQNDNAKQLHKDTLKTQSIAQLSRMDT